MRSLGSVALRAEEVDIAIKEELAAELKDAMRTQDRRRLDVIRQVETEVSAARTAPGFGGEVDDELYRQVIASYVKRMDKARQEYLDLGGRGAEMADKLGFEIEFLSRWLPEKLDEEQTRELVARTIEELGVSDPGQAGRVIGRLMGTRGEELDGALVNRLVREALGDRPGG